MYSNLKMTRTVLMKPCNVALKCTAVIMTLQRSLNICEQEISCFFFLNPKHKKPWIKNCSWHWFCQITVLLVMAQDSVKYVNGTGWWSGNPLVLRWLLGVWPMCWSWVSPWMAGMAGMAWPGNGKQQLCSGHCHVWQAHCHPQNTHIPFYDYSVDSKRPRGDLWG